MNFLNVILFTLSSVSAFVSPIVVSEYRRQKLCKRDPAFEATLSHIAAQTYTCSDLDESCRFIIQNSINRFISSSVHQVDLCLGKLADLKFAKCPVVIVGDAGSNSTTALFGADAKSCVIDDGAMLSKSTYFGGCERLVAVNINVERLNTNARVATVLMHVPRLPLDYKLKPKTNGWFGSDGMQPATDSPLKTFSWSWDEWDAEHKKS